MPNYELIKFSALADSVAAATAAASTASGAATAASAAAAAANAAAAAAPRWRGGWSSGTAYVVGDEVSYGGSSYISILGGTNHVPTNATYWSLVAEKGNVPTFDPMDYGAVADGVTDDGPALNAALAAAAAVNGTVLVPEGRYYITTAVDAVSNTGLQGVGSGTVFVINPAITGGLWLTVVGLVGTYRSNVRIGNFHVERSGAGGIRMQYARRCQVQGITGTGTGGGILSIRNIDNCQFSNIIGWNLGSAGGASIFVLNITDCQFSNIIGEGGQESIDLFETHRCQFTNVAGYNCGDEALDMGACQYNTFTNLLSYNSTNNGITCKVEDTATSGGALRNQFKNVVVIGQGLIGFSLGNSPATTGTSDVCNYCVVDGLYIYSTTSTASGVRIGGSTAQPVMTGHRIRNFHIVVPGICVNAPNFVNDITIQDGYAETTTVSTNPIEFTGTTDTFICQRVRVQNVRVNAAALTSASVFAFSFARCKDLRVEFCEVINAGNSSGMQLLRCKDFVLRGNHISECGLNGIVFTQVDEANWRGTINGRFTGNRIKNVGKIGGTRFCIRLINNSSTVGEAVYLEGNELYDTQGSKTGSGVQVNGGTGAGWDWCTYVGNTYRNLNSGLTGTFPGVNGVAANNLDASARA